MCLLLFLFSVAVAFSSTRRWTECRGAQSDAGFNADVIGALLVISQLAVGLGGDRQSSPAPAGRHVYSPPQPKSPQAP